MAGIKLERRSDVAPAAAGQGDSVGVGSFCAGTQLLVNCRYAEAFINATTAPVATQWEGPYLRITPELPNPITRGEVGQAKRLSTTADVFATTGGTVSPVGPELPMYEIDAIGQPVIYLPFGAKVELYTELSGAWIFDVMAWQEDSPLKQLSARGYAQTRSVAVAQAKILTVPFGCREFSMMGAGVPPILWAEETGKTVGLGSSSFLGSGVGASPGPCDRYPIMGARKFVLNNPPANPSAVIFWVYF